jgi:hypothetical protein
MKVRFRALSIPVLMAEMGSEANWRLWGGCGLLHLRRILWVDGSRNQSVLLQFALLLGQHARRHLSYGALHLIEP